MLADRIDPEPGFYYVVDAENRKFITQSGTEKQAFFLAGHLVPELKRTLEVITFIVVRWGPSPTGRIISKELKQISLRRFEY